MFNYIPGAYICAISPSWYRSTGLLAAFRLLSSVSLHFLFIIDGLTSILSVYEDILCVLYSFIFVVRSE